jgi:hypothetical protein
MTTVPQFIHRREIARRLDRVGATQGCLARCVGISDPQLSLVLSGQKLMSETVQLNTIQTLRFFEELAADHAPAPVRFSDVDAIEQLYKEWRRKHEDDQVVHAADEVIAASDAA